MPWCPVCEETWTTTDGNDTVQLTCEPCRLEATGNIETANMIRQESANGSGLCTSGAKQAPADDHEAHGPWRCPRCKKVWRRYTSRTPISTGRKTPAKHCAHCIAEVQQQERDKRESEERVKREAKARRDKKVRMQQELAEEREKARKWQPGSSRPSNRFGIKPRRRG